MRGPLVVASLALAACSTSPSPAQLQETLVQNPEVLFAVIQAHPTEFLAVLNKAAQGEQAKERAQSLRNEGTRLEEEFRNPKRPELTHRAGFGNPNARVTIVEYTDFECPFCREERETLVQLFKEYGDKVRLVVKQAPLDTHPHAMAAALMFEAIARQSPAMAYRFYDDVYTKQDQLQTGGQKFLEAAAGRAGADVARAIADQQSTAVRAIVAADLDEAKRFGFNGTPGFLVNGVAFQGAYPRPDFEKIIDRHLAMGQR
ncbi:MAG: hypothetical protein NVS4B3_01270 [Gemmatimonadaceae bacterium]